MHIAPETLRERDTVLYRAVGLPEEQAALVADTLVRADLWGHSSHGVMRAPWYLDRVRSGAWKPVTAAVRVVDAGAIAVVDGREGVGRVIALDAMLDAVARATRWGRHGICALLQPPWCARLFHAAGGASSAASAS